MSIEEAQATGHAVSLCSALALAACPIALWVGNLVTAAHYAEMLLDHSRKHSLPLLSAFGSRFQRAVIHQGGDVDTDRGCWRRPSTRSPSPTRAFRFLTGLTELAEALAHAGRIAEALALVEAGIEQSEGGWLTPELLRLKGELFLLQRRALQPRKRRRISSGRRSTRRADKVRCPGSCAPRRASPGCCVIRAAPPTPSPAFSRSTTALPRVSAPPI